MITLLKFVGPYLVVFAAGWSSAWWVQGNRLSDLQSEFDGYKMQQENLRIQAEKRQLKRQEETGNAWAANLNALRARYASGWMPKLPASATISQVCSTEGTDGMRGTPDAPAAGNAVHPESLECAEALKFVVQKAAEVQLKLNQLQWDIQKQ